MLGQRNNNMHVNLYMTFCVLSICNLNLYAGTMEHNCQTVLNADRSSHVYSIGETMRFQCKVVCSGNETADTSHLYIRHTTPTNLTGTCIESDQVTADYANFTAENVHSSNAGTYTCCLVDLELDGTRVCTDVSSNCSALGYLSLFHVCIKDEMVSTSISCIASDNFSKLTCSWTNQSRNQTDSIYWLMQYKTSSMTGYKCCINEDITDTCTNLSLLTFCNIAAEDVHENELYTVRLLAKSCPNAANYTIVETQNITTDDSILRLNPVDIDEIGNTTQGQLDINVSFDRIPIRGVICRVIGVSQWEDEPDHNETVTIKDTNLKETIRLSGLWPYTDYRLSLSCRPEHSPFWSDIVQIHGRTIQAPPSQVPTISAYTEKISLDGIQLYIYLQSLPERYRNGQSAESIVSIIDDERHVVVNQTYAAGNMTAVVSHSLKPDRKYQVRIGARNEAGVAAETINMNITTTTTDLSPYDVVVEEDRGTYRINVLNDNTGRPAEARRYAWCQGKSNAFPPICSSSMQMKSSIVMTPMGSHVVKPGLADPGNSWYFGITSSDSPTIPLVKWSKCSFRLLDRIDDRTKSLDVTVDRNSLSQNTSHVVVNLNFRYCDLPSRPMLYQLFVVDRGSNCSIESGDSRNFTATPEVRRLWMPVKDPYKSEICFLTLYNDGQESDFTTLSLFMNQPMVASSPASNDQDSSSIVVGISVGVGVPMLVALIFIFNYLRGKLTEKYNIETLNLHGDMETESTGSPQAIRGLEHALENSRYHSSGTSNMIEPLCTVKRPDTHLRLPYRQLPRPQEKERRNHDIGTAAVIEATLNEDTEPYETNSSDKSTMDYSQLILNNTQSEESEYSICGNDTYRNTTLQSDVDDRKEGDEVANIAYGAHSVISNHFELDRPNEVNSDTCIERHKDIDNDTSANVENEFDSSAETCDENAFMSIEINSSGVRFPNGTTIKVKESEGHCNAGIRQKGNDDFKMKLADIRDETSISSYVRADMTNVQKNTFVHVPNDITLQFHDMNNSDCKDPQMFCQESVKIVKVINKLNESERKRTNLITIKDATQDAPDSYQVVEVCIPEDNILKEAETNVDSYQKICVDRDDTSEVSSYIRYEDWNSFDSEDAISVSDG